MITALLARELPPATEGGSSRLVAVTEHLRARDPRFESIVAETDSRDGSRLSRLLGALPRSILLAIRSAFGRNRLILLSAPELPFFHTPSRGDAWIASSFLLLLHLLTRCTGRRIVLNLHDLRSLQLPDAGFDTPEEVLDIFRTLERRSLDLSDYVLTPGGRWPAYLADRYGVERSRQVDFPNGCIRQEPRSTPLPVLPGGTRFVYAGTMTPGREGHAEIVRDFLALDRDDVALVLLGPGGEFCAEMAAGDPRVVYLGARPVEECIEIVRACDVALYPYPSRFYFDMTHTTNKMALYLTCGLPVLANRSETVAEFVEGNDIGAICDGSRFGATMDRLASDRAALARMRRNVARIAESFYWDTIIDRAFATIAEREGLEPMCGTSLPREGAA